MADGYWMEVEQDDGDPITVHINGDPNPSPEARAALEDLARAAYKRMEQQQDQADRRKIAGDTIDSAHLRRMPKEGHGRA